MHFFLVPSDFKFDLPKNNNKTNKQKLTFWHVKFSLPTKK